MRQKDPAGAASALSTLRRLESVGAKAEFEGPEHFSGSGHSSRIRFINTSTDALSIIMGGATYATRFDVPGCTLRCSQRDDAVCRTNAVKTLSLPPGRYLMVMLSDFADPYGGSRGLWILSPGQVDQCVV